MIRSSSNLPPLHTYALLLLLACANAFAADRESVLQAEVDTRCFLQEDKPDAPVLRIQRHMDPATNWVGAYARYGRSYRVLPLVLEDEVELRRNGDRPSLMRSTWREFVGGKPAGRYEITSQFAAIEGLRYVDATGKHETRFVPTTCADFDSTQESKLAPIATPAVPAIVVLSNQAEEILGGAFPSSVSKVIRDSDPVAYYFAEVEVEFRDTAHAVRLTCRDKKGLVVIRAEYKATDRDGRLEVALGLDPAPGAMAPGQLSPLVAWHDYVFELEIDRQLIARTSFQYVHIKED